MKNIPLTQGQLALIDDEDFERVNQYKWQAKWEKRTKSFYAIMVTSRPNRKTIQMSRFIMQTPDSLICDHISHDTLDNQKSNLRNCTESQNRMNQKSRGTNTGIKCIHPTSNNRYQVHIRANSKTVYRKNFKTLEEALSARNEELKKHHGEFANTE
jgi:hypothetical protein